MFFLNVASNNGAFEVNDLLDLMKYIFVMIWGVGCNIRVHGCDVEGNNTF